jgi:pantoate kinase
MQGTGALPIALATRHQSPMSTSVAALEHPAAPAEHKPRRERAISKRMQQALTLLATKGVNQREAAKLVGMSEYHLSRELKKPQIQVFIERAARQNIQLGVLRASKRVLELVDAGSEHVSLDASKHILAIEGIKPSSDTQVSVNVDIKAGFVIDLSEPGRVTRTIEHGND